MPLAADGWEVARFLPNLRLPLTGDDIWNEQGTEAGRRALALASAWIAIVPHDDARVQAFANAYPITKKLIAAFADTYGHGAPPAALIVKKKSPVPRLFEAIAAFRNAVSVSFALRARAAVVTEKGWGGAAAWTDKFDFHPAEVDLKGNIQVHSSALVHFVGKPAKLAFAPSPLLNRDLDIRFVDDPLATLLSRAWKEMYIRKRRRPALRPLFRSLELANQAGAIPWKNAGSLHDVGITVAHWVSALETLIWPLHGRATQWHSVSYTADFGRDDSKLRHRRFTLVWNPLDPKRRKVMRATPTQKLCSLMYSARNAFLHGERVVSSHLAPKSEWPDMKVHHAAALLYRYALLKRLKELYPPRPVAPDEIPPFDVQHWFTEDAYERATLALFGWEPAPL